MKVSIFDEIFGAEAVMVMIELSEGTEDGDTIQEFRDKLIHRVSYQTLLKIAEEWKNLSWKKQVDTAVFRMEESHASRFMLYMDYLSEKITKKDVENNEL